MTSIVIDKFSGLAPKIDRKQLADNMAVVANNVYLDHLDLRGFPSAAAASGTVGATWRSMYLYRGNTWIGSNNKVEYAEAPVINDQYARIVVTDRTTYPRVYTLGTFYRLGIPAPNAPPTVTPTQTPSDPNAVDAETVSYVVTYVDAFGNEGPPSLPTVSIDRVRDTNVTITNLPTAPTGEYNFGGNSRIRIYRSNTGTDATGYQYVKELPLGTTSTTDDVPSANLGELLPSADWTGPPDDDTTKWKEPMRGVVSLPNGMLAGFTDKTLVFNEPYLLHAWPTSYAITFSEKIVSIVPIAAGLLVLTHTQPFLVSGVHPSSMAVQAIDLMQGCINEDSVVDMGEYAIYASPDGLVAVYGMQAELITRDLMLREHWNTLYSPDTMNSYLWEGKYIGFYDNGSKQGAIVFDPREGTRALIEVDSYYNAAYFFPKLDQLYVTSDGSTSVLKFGREWSVPMTYNWKSKRFVTPKPVSFATCRIEVEDGDYSDITVEISADSNVVYTFSTAALGFSRHTPYCRLPSGFRAKVWAIRITGTSTVTYIGLFESMEEAI